MLHDVSDTHRVVCTASLSTCCQSTAGAFLSSFAPAVVSFQSVECSWLSQHNLCRQRAKLQPLLDDLGLEIKVCLAYISLLPCTNLTCCPMLRLPNELQR